MFTKIIQLFNQWSKLKIYIHLNKDSQALYFKEKQVWWASIGQNIGVESNGKNQNFERPVIILKKFSAESFLAVMLSTKHKTGHYYYQLMQNTTHQTSFVNLTQIKLMSSKRLIRKMTDVKDIDFVTIRSRIKRYL